jgi:hypothetical protein
MTACAACGGTDLEPHLQVAGEMGDQGLIPTTDRFGTALSDIVRCRGCGHMQRERFPSDADVGARLPRPDARARARPGVDFVG